MSSVEPVQAYLYRALLALLDVAKHSQFAEQLAVWEHVQGTQLHV